MPFETEIRFEFLCAFAPPRPFDQAPDECRVVLPDLRDEPPEQRHYPCLLYDPAERVAAAELEAAGIAPRAPEPEEFSFGSTLRLIALDGEDVEIRPDGQAAAANELTVGPISSLLRIANAQVDLELLDREIVTAATPPGVAARLRLRQGKLAEAEVTPDDFSIHRSDKPSPVHTGKVARRVTLRVEAQDFLDLAFRPFGAPAAEERVLRLRAPAGDAVVTFRNCEKDFVWEEALPGYDDQSDSEMNLFFRFAADYDPNHPPPDTRVKLRIQPTGPNGVCAPKAFDGWK